MIVQTFLRTRDLARAGQISVQHVRNYEASGLLPPAERGPNGYRLYTQKHLAALTTAQRLSGVYGVQRARAIMQAVHAGELAAALELIDARHAEIAAQRAQLEQTLAALRMLAAQPAPYSRSAQPLRVGEAARQVGVRVSAVHFWEQQGLLQPARERNSRYRLYDERQMRRLRVVTLLRGSGYDFEAIRTTLDELSAGRPERVIAAVEQRRAALSHTSWAALGAGSALRAYVEEFWPELSDGM
jgi:DNA-binding transcriptional MerR regulator